MGRKPAKLVWPNATPDASLRFVTFSMSEFDPGQITRLLTDASAGNAVAEERLLELVYDELRRIAQRHMASEKPGNTLQPTALVHEAYLRLGGATDGLRFENRGHFFTAVAEAMRRILIESARRRGRLKRGGDRERVEFVAEAFAAPSGDDPQDLLLLNELIERLEAQDAEVAVVVKLRHFVGFTVEEVAEALERSERSVYRQWSVGRAWLKRELLRDRSRAASSGGHESPAE